MNGFSHLFSTITLIQQATGTALVKHQFYRVSSELQTLQKETAEPGRKQETRKQEPRRVCASIPKCLYLEHLDFQTLSKQQEKRLH